MAYRFGVGSLPGPRFTPSRTSGHGIFVVTPVSSEEVDAAREKTALAEDLVRKKRMRPMRWSDSSGELARLLSLSRKP
ncbi:MAG TPA: hypothetical protein VG820_09985 [Fimbriimonadaceae bacterium]|nr:hypothetical protein [Fimbriimonadaceae bacterium]